MESVIEKLKKIKSLAEQGFGNEARAAELALERLLKKYNLTIEDLAGETKKQRCFIAKTDNEKALFFMCILKVVRTSRSRKAFSRRGASHKLYIELTDCEFVEVSQLYSFHRANIKKEFEKVRKEFQIAYQYKHDLYDNNCQNDSDDDNKTVDAKEIERIIMHMRGMQDVQFHKQIENHIQ